MKHLIIFVCLAGAFVLFLSGCATYEGSSSAATQEREDALVLREDINRCQSRLETMEIEQKQILSEIQQLRARGGDEGSRVRLDELERRVSALDAARSSDRKEIVEQISANVAKMMSGTPAAASGTTNSKKVAPKAVSPSTTSTTGYEHIVKENETLSAIASAYKVKLSAIVEANDLKKPYTLRKGQKLFIPQQ